MFLVGHLLLGAVLGLQPQLVESLSNSFGGKQRERAAILPAPADPGDESRIQ